MSKLSQPAAIEYELDSLAHSFSQAASELEQREHWQRTEGLVIRQRSMMDVGCQLKQSAASLSLSVSLGWSVEECQSASYERSTDSRNRMSLDR